MFQKITADTLVTISGRKMETYNTLLVFLLYLIRNFNNLSYLDDFHNLF